MTVFIISFDKLYRFLITVTFPFYNITTIHSLSDYPHNLFAVRTRTKTQIFFLPSSPFFFPSSAYCVYLLFRLQSRHFMRHSNKIDLLSLAPSFSLFSPSLLMLLHSLFRRASQSHPLSLQFLPPVSVCKV